MQDRNVWLALTTEQAIEPDLPICDPHHHLWVYPNDRYLLDDFLQDIGDGHNITRTVFVECLQFYRPDGRHELKPVGETEQLEQIANNCQDQPCKVAAGIVGFADLSLGSAVQPVLESHLAASSRFRGVRYASAFDASDRIHNAHTKPTRGLLANPAFREGFACLERFGLSFDAWLYHPQIPELIDLALAFPRVPIILDHMAGPLGIGPYAGQREQVFSDWRRHITALADCENVSVKLGGMTMTMAGFGWHKRKKPPGSELLAETMGPYYRACIEAFGPERCMFESNFPVDRASCSYTVLWNAFKRLSHDYSTAERKALFHDTAVDIYRL